MNSEQLKNKSPELYNAIFKAGITEGAKVERERVESWLDYADTNLDEVKQGIACGNDLKKDVDDFYAEIDSKIKSIEQSN